MKQVISLGFFMCVASACVFGASAGSVQSKPAAPAKQVAPPSLTKEEQAFADQLSQPHKQIFLTVFTPAMREEALSYMDDDNVDEDDDLYDELPITADRAVEVTLSRHRDPGRNDDETSHNK